MTTDEMVEGAQDFWGARMDRHCLQEDDLTTDKRHKQELDRDSYSFDPRLYLVDVARSDALVNIAQRYEILHRISYCSQKGLG